MRVAVIVFVSLFGALEACAQNLNWEGQWITDRGVMKLTQTGNKVTGDYATEGTLSGTVSGNKLTVEFKNGRSNGKGTFEFDESQDAFTGRYQAGRNSGTWRGWRKDRDAEAKDDADFSGTWLSTMGTIQLDQNGDAVTGFYGTQGWKTLTGEVAGRRLKFSYKDRAWSGTAWLEQTEDGKRIFGMTEGDKPIAWTGMRLDGFELDAQPKAGEMVDGRTENGMLYHLRMPDGWKQGDKVDLVILLHGSNWTTKGMVWVTAKNWPDVGKKFAILGIQGEQWNKYSEMESPRFNYTYVNWVGRSTYGGFPWTDRESPYLVAKFIDDVKEKWNLDRVFVGGHSQGGYLTYVMHMHFPEKLAGTFPIAGGLIMQAEPDVFEDDDLRKAQRDTPMAIVHGTKDSVVGFSSGQYNYNRFLAHQFPKIKFIAPDMGHPYDFLPVGEAIEYLDALSTSDAKLLEKFAYAQADKGNWRDVGAAIQRAKVIGGGQEFSKVWNMMEDAAEKEVEKHALALGYHRDNKWIDAFLQWQEQFQMTDVAKPLNEQFQELWDKHEPPAKELYNDARKAFRSGNRNGGYAKYQEIVDKYYASSYYRTVKKTLDDRK